MRMIFLPILRVLLGLLILSGITPARAQTPWKASADDALLFDVRLGQYRLGEGVRGYQTPQGACLDLADDVIKRIDELTAHDREIYEYGKTLFLRQLKNKKKKIFFF